MLNVYVHLAAAGLSPDAVEDDAFLDRLWRALPDASVADERDGSLGITLSQFSMSDAAASRRQAQRVKDAMAELGHDDARVVVVETTRYDWHDDVSVVAHTVRWHADSLVRRIGRR